MSVSPNDEKRDLEAEHTKEEDWEVVSGLRSLPPEETTVSPNAEQKEIEPNIVTSDNTSKEPERKVDDTEEKKTEEDVEKDPEDWYQTIPPTPMNTPEFTPIPPSYPSASRKSENQNGPEDTELPPITEEMLEDQFLNNTTPEEDGANSDVDQGHLQDHPTSSIVKKSIDIIIFSLSRLAIFVIVFSFVKWLFSKACQQIRSIKATRSDSK